MGVVAVMIFILAHVIDVVIEIIHALVSDHFRRRSSTGTITRAAGGIDERLMNAGLVITALDPSGGICRRPIIGVRIVLHVSLFPSLGFLCFSLEYPPPGTYII